VMNADGSAQTNLTNTPAANADELSPSWQYIYKCGGRRATIVGDDGPDKIKGTKRADVIVANGGNDTVKGRGGADRICLGKGKDKAVGGSGKDLCAGGKGKDTAVGCEKGKL
jgi:Ca2+-binding RTX toxin-like protein